MTLKQPSEWFWESPEFRGNVRQSTVRPGKLIIKQHGVVEMSSLFPQSQFWPASASYSSFHADSEDKSYEKRFLRRRCVTRGHETRAVDGVYMYEVKA